MKTKISAAIIGLFLLAACGSDQPKEGEQAATPAEAAKPTKFILKGANMMYIAIAPADSALIANQPDPTKAEVFEKTDIGEGKCVLKASNGRYMFDNRNAKDQIFANSSNPWGWETFEVVALDQSKVNIKTSAGKFLSCDLGNEGRVFGSNDKASDWEAFIMEPK